MDTEVLMLILLHLLTPLVAGMVWYWLVMPSLGRWEPFIYFNVLWVALLVATSNYLRNYRSYADWTVAEYYELAGKTQMLIFIVLLILIAISYARTPKPEPMKSTGDEHRG